MTELEKLAKRLEAETHFAYEELTKKGASSLNDLLEEAAKAILTLIQELTETKKALQTLDAKFARLKAE